MMKPLGSGAPSIAEPASPLVGRYRNGVFFVALAQVREPALVLPSVTQALGVSEVPGQSLAKTLTDVSPGEP